MVVVARQVGHLHRPGERWRPRGRRAGKIKYADAVVGAVGAVGAVPAAALGEGEVVSVGARGRGEREFEASSSGTIAKRGAEISPLRRDGELQEEGGRRRRGRRRGGGRVE